ncbi:Rossmann-fold NAD(P)(+)-binding protein [Pochonia chlamydosporia 170]|uniref:Rossmann-fold NAD(P)(+)-binding protein n=1 Tax=Pochonia chlamydosporia 170 TaxID=1380566 RepID=A0A179FJH9_METCM|nr:Rossmann-fold NAD(P)(+)-binding protein [Pochonia chlamydosporia 170]OAQ65189.2 Rossmann-fold NAD(P)(+)-binding protein [Pochonia chlamydosporia 170]
MRLGRYPMQRAAPLTPGYCFVGRVKRNGSGCNKFQIGDAVAALTVYDSQSELLNLPESKLISVPEDVDLQTACALVLDWATAYGMVFNTAKVAKDQRVFVHGLSGAVGQAIMSLSQGQGAIVYGTASERNHPDLKTMGVHPFSYRDKAWIKEMQTLGGAHAVFDALGFESFDESYSILCDKEPARLVGYGANLPYLGSNEAKYGSPIPSVVKLLARNSALWCNRSTRFYDISKDKEFEQNLGQLFKLVQQGRVNVPIKQVWGLDDIREAHGSWGKAQGMGSILIRISHELAVPSIRVSDAAGGGS